ncbi:hypothetical protein RHSIM_Rhsim09G0066800 [Rhododendron simsii]|uniref:Uncharacterized protein n=1 Tax=Rhododendron simsii TaxID=118357 RepID=A0A834LDL6_RHOSS|nr:hypothetical protein RHSIM_Rhsim09G0066800 [Rhododendron simsii]
MSVLLVQACGMCFGDKCLRSVITFEAERGYRNALCNNMRFKNFLFPRVSKLCSQSKHKIAEKLLVAADRYDAASVPDRSKLLNKWSPEVDRARKPQIGHETARICNHEGRQRVALVTGHWVTVALVVRGLYGGCKVWICLAEARRKSTKVERLPSPSPFPGECKDSKRLSFSISSLGGKIVKSSSNLWNGSKGCVSAFVEEHQPSRSLIVISHCGVNALAVFFVFSSKVSVLMGYNGLQDLIESERAQKESVMKLKDGMGDFNVSLACKQFPSIIFGCSPPIELYDDGLLSSEICKEFLSSSLGTKWVNPDSPSESWTSLYPCLPDRNPSFLREESANDLPLSSEPFNLEAETDTDVQLTLEESSTRAGLEIDEKAEESSTRAGLEIDEQAASVELILDKSISFIPRLTKRQFGQLENSGFHTLRKLLHHFPRTYADLQNAQIGIADGQYLIFVGNILSSR